MTGLDAEAVLHDVIAPLEPVVADDIDEAVTNYHLFMRKLVRAIVPPLDGAVARLAKIRGITSDKTTTCVLPNGDRAFLVTVEKDWNGGHTLFAWTVATGEEKSKLAIRGSLSERNGVYEAMQTGEACELEDVVGLCGLLRRYLPERFMEPGRDPYSRLLAEDGGLPGPLVLKAERGLRQTVARIAFEEIVALIDAVATLPAGYEIPARNGESVVVLDPSTIRIDTATRSFVASTNDMPGGRYVDLMEDDVVTASYVPITGMVETVTRSPGVDVLDQIHSLSAQAREHVQRSLRPEQSPPRP